MIMMAVAMIMMMSMIVVMVMAVMVAVRCAHARALEHRAEKWVPVFRAMLPQKLAQSGDPDHTSCSKA